MSSRLIVLLSITPHPSFFNFGSIRSACVGFGAVTHAAIPLSSLVSSPEKAFCKSDCLSSSNPAVCYTEMSSSVFLVNFKFLLFPSDNLMGILIGCCLKIA